MKQQNRLFGIGAPVAMWAASANFDKSGEAPIWMIIFFCSLIVGMVVYFTITWKK